MVSVAASIAAAASATVICTNSLAAIRVTPRDTRSRRLANATASARLPSAIATGGKE